MLSYPQGRDRFQRHNQFGQGNLGWICHKNVSVVLVSFIGIKSSTISSTHFTKDLTEQLRHSGCHHLSSVLGYKDNMGVHVINHMSSGAKVHMSHIIYIHQDY